ncbi:hypothetical protein, partial [Serratia marcescens]|uniref:hypothetical protein n=1 Tax=Serratia marcescens TaxID=615 RepID=UPI001CA32740
TAPGSTATSALHDKSVCHSPLWLNLNHTAHKSNPILWSETDLKTRKNPMFLMQKQILPINFSY